MIFLRSRYYDPATGTFISRDTYPGTLTNPASQHRYTYTENNPINYTDPSGHLAFLVTIAVGAAGGLIAGLAYYAGKTYLSNDPCVHWDWKEALLWSGVGAGIGAFLGGGFYGGWWVGTQMGWWGGVNTGSYSVYQLIENGSVRYIGQTNNFSIRAATWLKTRGWNIAPIKGLQRLNIFDARAVEQTLIELYGLENLYNKINSIGPNNPIYYYAILRGAEILNKIGYVKIE